MDPKSDDPVEFFAKPADFERWLRKHHAKASCVWVKYAKKKSGIASIDWDQAVDVALCYGWIDGQSKSLDETYSLQRFTPREAEQVVEAEPRTRRTTDKRGSHAARRPRRGRAREGRRTLGRRIRLGCQ